MPYDHLRCFDEVGMVCLEIVNLISNFLSLSKTMQYGGICRMHFDNIFNWNYLFVIGRNKIEQIRAHDLDLKYPIVERICQHTVLVICHWYIWSMEVKPYHMGIPAKKRTPMGIFFFNYISFCYCQCVHDMWNTRLWKLLNIFDSSSSFHFRLSHKTGDERETRGRYDNRVQHAKST